MRKKVVLAHGLLGFADFGNGLVTYFNGVRKRYAELGCEVLPPVVTATGSLAHRSAELAVAIHQPWGDSQDPIYMIGHSMGGLDCRRVIAQDEAISKRVHRMITVCTPHFGSPVSDAASAATSPLRPLIPRPLVAALRSEAGAVEDLRTGTVLQDGYRHDVDYVCVSGDATQLSPASEFSVLAHKIHAISGEANDGVVTAASAAGERIMLPPLWQVDHGGAIGSASHLLGLAAAVNSPPAGHLKQYENLLRILIA